MVHKPNQCHSLAKASGNKDKETNDKYGSKSNKDRKLKLAEAMQMCYDSDSSESAASEK